MTADWGRLAVRKVQETSRTLAVQQAYRDLEGLSDCRATGSTTTTNFVVRPPDDGRDDWEDLGVRSGLRESLCLAG